MSKNSIALTQGEGISTTLIVAKNKESGNTRLSFNSAYAERPSRISIDMAADALKDGARALARVAAICQAIRKEASTPDGCRITIRQLAEAGSYIAHDISNHLDVEQDELRGRSSSEPAPHVEQEADSSAAFPDGYEAAHTWWRAFLDARDAAKPYEFDSNLRNFGLSLPIEQLGEFLDAVGALVVCWMTAGEPARECKMNAPRIAFTRLSPEEQDAQFDDDGEPVTDLAREIWRSEAAAGGRS